MKVGKNEVYYGIDSGVGMVNKMVKRGMKRSLRVAEKLNELGRVRIPTKMEAPYAANPTYIKVEQMNYFILDLFRLVFFG